MDPKTIVTWITIVTAIAGGIARFAAVQERSDIQVHEIAKLQSDVEALQRDRALLERVHAIEVRIAEMEAAAGSNEQRKGHR